MTSRLEALLILMKPYVFSENDLFAFEIEAGGTQFQAGSDARTALETLVDSDQWMIYRNIFTNVLHWDFVSPNLFLRWGIA